METYYNPAPKKRSFKWEKFTFFSQMVSYDMAEQAVVEQQKKTGNP